MSRSGLEGKPLALEGAQKPRSADRESESLHRLPKELGVLLVTAGIGGLLLPGPVGTPFLILGGVTLWPAAFNRVEACFAKRFPRLHHAGMIQIKRFITDLERRYPTPR